MARRTGRLDPARVVIDEDDFDPYPRQIGHKAAVRVYGRSSKSLNENLSPLRRFLDGQVGRPWDAVWSEISEHLKPSSTVQQHVRDHVSDFVAIKTFAKDGIVYHARDWGGPLPLTSTRRSWLKLYVDPETGILRRIPGHKSMARWRREAKLAQAAAELDWLRRIGPMHVLVLLDDGNWWDVQLGPERGAAQPVAGARGHLLEPVDVIDAANLSSRPRTERYGQSGVKAIAKRPLSKRQLKQHRLR